MTDEEKDRPLAAPNLPADVQNKMNTCTIVLQNGDLSPEEEMDIRIQVLSEVLEHVAREQ